MKKDTESVTTIANQNQDLNFVIRRHPISKVPVVYKCVEASIDEIAESMVPFSGIGQ